MAITSPESTAPVGLSISWAWPAMLSAKPLPLPMAVLSIDLSTAEDGWFQLLPDGYFSAVDGRPYDVPGGKWFIDRDIAQRLISLAQSASNDLVIDYEHQTLLTEKNGQPAPAAGWFKSDMEWREGSGLWIRPRWTDRAQGYIDNNEYRFLSAVFPYDKKTGVPLALHSAALVNRAGIDGMEPLAHLTAQPSNQQETVMNKQMRDLLAKLGIEVADGADPTEEQATAALSAVDALKAKADKSGELETEVAALKAGTSGVDLSKYVPVATYNAVSTELATLKATGAVETAERVIEDARKVGKVFAAEMDYLSDFAKQQGVAALKAMLDARPEMAALSASQTQEKGRKQDKDKEDKLTAEDLAVLKATGISAEEFLKSKKALAAN